MKLNMMREEWIERMEAALERLVQRVQDEDAGAAGISVAITIKRGEANEMIGTFVLKSAESLKEEWTPGVKQLLLPVDDGIDTVTLSSGDRSVTLGRRKVTVPV